MEGNRVYLAACPDYGQAEAKLREAVAALGGMERFVRPGERILLKAATASRSFASACP